MSDDSPKSALELAMERLRKKDAADGIAELTLTDEQREEIAEIRRVYSAKIAQEEILYKSQLATTWEPEERMKLEEGHRREMQRLNEERDRKIEKVRG
jgi:demethoxyubiquinone hydroxylase (CLK1/Coq7/Cat5 family)